MCIGFRSGPRMELKTGNISVPFPLFFSNYHFSSSFPEIKTEKATYDYFENTLSKRYLRKGIINRTTGRTIVFGRHFGNIEDCLEKEVFALAKTLGLPQRNTYTLHNGTDFEMLTAGLFVVSGGEEIT
jgi:hypothetical protein